MIGMDDKASILVSYSETPVAATVYNNVQTVVPAGTKIHAADHDYSGLAKIVPSVSVDMNIGQDPNESVLSGGEGGHGQIYASLHDEVFLNFFPWTF